MLPALAVATFVVAATVLSPSRAHAQDDAGVRCGAGPHSGETDGFVLLPEGRIFCPLTADPKAEHSFISFLSGDFPSITEIENDTHVASVGVGDDFPLARWAGRGPADGVQVSLTGGVFAQFDLRSSSFDLINADYVIGIPATFRSGGFTMRLRPYHQSSHLGDEFLLRDEEVERQNLSFESVEMILSQELGGVRLYGGGEYLFNRDPEWIEELLAHAGAEVRVGAVRGPHAVLAVDVKSTEEQDWEPAVSVRGGLELAVWRDHGHPPRVLGILAEYYTGPSPYGQFFRNEIRFFGVGVHFSL
jgi:hypothetical protein